MMYMSRSSLRAAMFSTLVLLLGLSTSSSKDRPADAADPPPTTDADVLADIARYASDNGLSGLSPASLAPVGPTVTRDERVGLIAFASERSGNSEIYVMNADGSALAQRTDNPADDGAPAWSPDGTALAFHTSRDGNYEIYVMNADGTGVTAADPSGAPGVV